MAAKCFLPCVIPLRYMDTSPSLPQELLLYYPKVEEECRYCVFDMIGGMQEESEAGPRCFVLLWLHLMPASKPCLWFPTRHEISIVCGGSCNLQLIVHQQAENIRR